MDKQSIISYICEQGGTDIPTLQQKFGLSYRAARDLINDLISADKLSFEQGIRYVYNANESVPVKSDGCSGADNSCDDDAKARRYAEIERMRKEYDDIYCDDYDDYDDYDDDCDDDGQDGCDDDGQSDSVSIQRTLTHMWERSARRRPVDEVLKSAVKYHDVRISSASEQTLHDVCILLHDYSRELDEFPAPQITLWDNSDELELCACDRLAYIVEKYNRITLTDARREAVKMRVALEGEVSPALEACMILEYYLNQCMDAGFNVIVHWILRR